MKQRLQDITSKIVESYRDLGGVNHVGGLALPSRAAVGRILDYRDMPTVRSISRQAARTDNRFSSFVMSIVKSAPFQMRTRLEAESTTTRVANSR